MDLSYPVESITAYKLPNKNKAPTISIKKVPTTTAVPALEFEKQKEISLKIRFKPLRRKEHKMNTSSSAAGIRCNECGM
ncbi:hypothetical protein IEQ34_005866 [Dendrobium chrysotoxum]|uniref:Uncharacterized protein n=1 Tax=Dendrobium chrysotoxum TaxID=161865 RepID=A0AAV7HCM0_DENCH|nr:hypothetical protein IEQ34_005866 [Dendrobium chrysotoxum]